MQRVLLSFTPISNKIQNRTSLDFFCLKGSPFNLFKNLFNLFNSVEFQKAQRVSSFTILSLRYGADFRRSRLVLGFFGGSGVFLACLPQSPEQTQDQRHCGHPWLGGQGQESGHCGRKQLISLPGSGYQHWLQQQCPQLGQRGCPSCQEWGRFWRLYLCYWG